MAPSILVKLKISRAQREALTSIPEMTKEKLALIHEVKRKLRCTECLQIREPPVHQCPKSHLVCRPCHGKEKRCNICKSTDLIGRVFILEKLYPYLVVPCANKGCNFVGPSTDYLQHKKTCEFYRVACPERSCSAKFLPANVFEHFAAMHPEQLVRNDEHAKRIMVQYTEDNSRICTNIIKHEGEIFLLSLYVIKGNKHLEYLSTNFERNFKTKNRKYFVVILPRNEENRRKRVRCYFQESTLTQKEAGLVPKRITNQRFPCDEFFYHNLELKFYPDELRFELNKGYMSICL